MLLTTKLLPISWKLFRLLPGLHRNMPIPYFTLVLWNPGWMPSPFSNSWILIMVEYPFNHMHSLTSNLSLPISHTHNHTKESTNKMGSADWCSSYSFVICCYWLDGACHFHVWIDLKSLICLFYEQLFFISVLIIKTFIIYIIYTSFGFFYEEWNWKFMSAFQYRDI